MNSAAPVRDPADLPRAENAGVLRGEMLYRQLGTTGVEVSLIGLGGAHIGGKSITDADSIRIQHEAADRGINFFDNCWDYHDGRSELLMGQALAQGGYRDKVFLMTKIDGRTKQSAMQQLDESLKRLRTDHIDLVQHHEVLRHDDPTRIFDEDGAMEALVEAKQAGKLRFIGFTGHKDPEIHLYMLDVAKQHGFQLDTVQMPLNVFDAHYRSFSHMVVQRAVEDGVGVLAMKTLADGKILKSKAQVTPIECIHYAMNLPTSVVICGIDKQPVLDQAFEAVKTFKLMDKEALSELLGRTAEEASDGRYELFKTSGYFDGTARNPDWLGGENKHVEELTAGD